MSAIPDRATVIEAWRAWQVVVGLPALFADALACASTVPAPPPQLVSLNQHEPWPARQRMIAKCDRSGRPGATALHRVLGLPVPTMKCTCGLYALRTREQLQSRFPSDSYVHGRIALWGEVIEHKNGFRAQYGYPLELWITVGDVHVGWALGQAYGIPVHLENRTRATRLSDMADALANFLTSSPFAGGISSPQMGAIPPGTVAPAPAGPGLIHGPSSSTPGPPWAAPPPPSTKTAYEVQLQQQLMQRYVQQHLSGTGPLASLPASMLQQLLQTREPYLSSILRSLGIIP